MQPDTRLTVRLIAPGRGPSDLQIEALPVPAPEAGDVLVKVRAASITRDELTWPTDRLPAIPSYEVTGVVAAVGAGVATVAVGDEVFGLTPFDRDGVAAEFATVPAAALAPKPTTLGDIESAALPMPGLTAWQGLFTHGNLAEGERVLIHGAAGGVGHIAAQLALSRGTNVVGTARGDGVGIVRKLGVAEVIDTSATTDLVGAIGSVDVVFDTVGGELLAQAPSLLAPGGRLIAVAEEPPEGVEGTFFIVEPDVDQLVALAGLAERGVLTTAIDATYPLADAVAAFERVASSSKRGKVVLEVSA
ncbi:MAG TPA: NADP-dependent oxidoreductase [Actinomycetota bacterium]|jgi:NADPH:quinone reductase-like Zn-dependent oxidoreductase|nr:NADP-dependent oxidoreductase [Actinomycetota bacterium]